MKNPHADSFIKLFSEIGRHHHRHEVFRDFVTMASISLNNSILKDEDLEAQYLQVVKRYSKQDSHKMASLFGEVVLGLEHSFCDFLGHVYMHLELGSDQMGQFFTPYEVARMMTEVTLGDSLNVLEEKPFITLSDPAVGAGGFIIAFAELLLERGYNPQKQLWVCGIDVDHIAGMMCYIQLSLLHIPAEVVIGNALTMECRQVLRTPAHWLGLWCSRLSNQEDQLRAPSGAQELPQQAQPTAEISFVSKGSQIELFKSA